MPRESICNSRLAFLHAYLMTIDVGRLQNPGFPKTSLRRLPEVINPAALELPILRLPERLGSGTPEQGSVSESLVIRTSGLQSCTERREQCDVSRLHSWHALSCRLCLVKVPYPRRLAFRSLCWVPEHRCRTLSAQDRASLLWWTAMRICSTLARASYVGPPQRQGKRVSQVWNRGHCASPS